MLADIFAKIPTLQRPDALRQLVTLALDMLLRRDQDQALRHRLAGVVGRSIDALPRGADAAANLAALQRTAQDCMTLLQAAADDRLPRDAAPTPQPASPRRAAAPKAVVALAVLLLLAVGGMVTALATADRWQQNRPLPLTAATLARQITATAADPGAAGDSNGTPSMRRLRDADQHVIVLVAAVPRRLCPATGRILAQTGKLTINGVAPPRRGRAAITALCFQGRGDSDLTWSPRATPPLTSGS
jgi:hypothetical protein